MITPVIHFLILYLPLGPYTSTSYMPTRRRRTTPTRRLRTVTRTARRRRRTPTRRRSMSYRKARGGSPASSRVEAMVSKQCAYFDQPAAGPNMQAIRHDYGGYAIQAGGGDATSSASTAGVSKATGGDNLQGSCPNTTSTIPHDHDNYYRWRGNEGDSNVFGTSVPSNPFQNTSDWFNGKSTLLTPSRFDAGVQNQARYFTNDGNGALTGMPSMMNKTVEVPAGVEGPNTQMAATFEVPYANTSESQKVLPLFRAGARKPRRRLRRRVRKSARRLRRR